MESGYDIKTIMIYTHVLNWRVKSVKNPVDNLNGDISGVITETIYNPGICAERRLRSAYAGFVRILLKAVYIRDVATQRFDKETIYTLLCV